MQRTDPAREGVRAPDARAAAPALRAPAEPLRAPRRFVIDPARSHVEFAVRFLGLFTVRGRFRDLSGTMVYRDGDARVPAEVSASVGVGSIDTGIRLRDRHLRSGGYFDVKRFPIATFRSTEFVPTISGFTIAGVLSMHGVSDAVTLIVELPVDPQHPTLNGRRRLVGDGDTTLYRSDYRVGASGLSTIWNLPHLLIGDEVEVTLHVEAVAE